MEHTLRVDIKTSQKNKQLNWFISNYSNIFPDLSLNLYFLNIQPQEVFDFSTINSKKVKTFTFQSFFKPFTVENIRNLEAFSYIVIPLKLESENLINTFISNVSKVKNKDKILCLIDSSNFVEFSKIGRATKFCFDNGIKNFSIAGFTPKSELAIKEFLLKNDANIISMPKDIKYQIDEQGNVRNPKNKQILSTIYKHLGFLLFP